MKILRTPDSRFEGLPDYPFAPHYSTIRDADGTALRIHTVDEGPRDAAPVLMLHGEPSWSFLYRKMIAGLVAKGHRAVAPDLIGFGKSDKPAEQSDYTFERHVKWMSDWLVATDLKQHHAVLPGLGRADRSCGWSRRFPSASRASSWRTPVCRSARA